jgi:hypothetical protein
MVSGLALALAVTGCAGEGQGEGESGDGATFTTSLAGDRPLTSLNESELDTLCADQAMFLSGAAFRADACRLSAVLAAAFSTLGEGEVTDASLRAACSNAYSECLNAGARASMCEAERPVASCTATVGDVAACLNDGAAQAHLLAIEAPDCDSLSTADVTSMSGELPAGVTGESESCQRLQTSCPSISEDARAFSDEYCALIAPCCTEAGLGSQCTANLYETAEQGTFDEAAGAACLDALRERQASPGFCDGLAPAPWAPWQVVPECDAVFDTDSGRNVAAPEPGVGPSAPPPASAAPPLPPGIAAPPAPGGAELPSTAEPGHACAGTRSSYPDGSSGTGLFDVAPPPGSVVCDHNQGLYCDFETRVCTPVRGVGESCLSDDECDFEVGYCEPSARTCSAHIQPGGACTGLIGECAPPSLCDSTMKCTVPPSTGEACSDDPRMPSCASGSCVDGICESPLAPLCGS